MHDTIATFEIGSLVWASMAFLVLAVALGGSRVNASDNLAIHILDVGQGDAMILHQPGSCTVLIDAGPLLHGHRITNKIEKMDVSLLDLAIITHPHLDHFGGLFDLLPRVGAAHFYDNGATNQVWEYFDDYRKLRTLQPYKTLARGDALTCGAMEIKVLHPDSSYDPNAKLNDTSLVLMISYGNFQLLHMGDLAGNEVSKFLAANDDLKANVLKIAHHGAADAASEKLLRSVSPEYAIISTAPTNRIGSPDQTVLSRLDQLEIPYLRTDQSGDIALTVNQDGYHITTSAIQ